MQGFFIGYCQQAGGGWNGDVEIVDWDELESAETVSTIGIKRFKADEVFAVKNGEKFRFPLADGDLAQPGLRPREKRKRRLKLKKRKEKEEEQEEEDA